MIPFAALMLASCTKYDYNQDLDKFNDCIFYSEDTETGEATVSSHGSIAVIGDLSTSSYTVKINNVQLFEGAPLRSCTVSNLQQYYQEKSEEEKQTALYYFFKQEGQTRTSGDLDVTGLRYGFLTGTYWLSFGSEERYKIWSIPRVRSLYANRNTILSPLSSLGACSENAIHPAYRFTLNPTAKTVTVKGQNVKFPQNMENTNQTLTFASMEWKDIPVEFTSTGFTFEAEEIIPLIGGEPAPQHKISNLKAEIAFDYEGTKRVTYKMLNGPDGQNILITTEFDLLRNPK